MASSAASDAAADDAENSNPFLSSPVVSSPLAPPQAPVASLQALIVSKTGAHAMGAPLQSQPGAVAPTVNDPHAEFRQDRWQKPAMLILVAAAILGGLLFLLPEADKKEATKTPRGERERAAIGGSVSPLIVELPEKDLSEKKIAPRAEASSEESATASKRSAGEFPGRFKSQAE